MVAASCYGDAIYYGMLGLMQSVRLFHNYALLYTGKSQNKVYIKFAVVTL